MTFSLSAASIMKIPRNTKCSPSRPAACSADISVIPTPMVNLKMKAHRNSENYLATIRALPDTGASIDCVEESYARRHNLEIKPDTSSMIELINAEGKVMKVIGTTKILLRVRGGTWVTTVALVCPRLSHQMLLSWQTQKKLQMLHEGWPFSIIHSANTAYNHEFNTTPKRFRPKVINPDPQIPQWPKELQDLCLEFSDVLVEEFEEAMNITCPLMDLELNNTSKPFFARKPKKHPLHWAQKIKKEVKKLVKAGVIERVPPNEAAAWISPAQFIAKDIKEEKLRLVCDLRQLNKGVKPDCSVFPTPSEVMMSVNPASKYYVKLDMLQGYHQIPLSDKSKNLFVFALEDGLYRYTRAPMGYTGSSHYFT